MSVRRARRRRGRLATAMAVWSVAGAMPVLAQESPPYYGPHMWDGGWWMFFGPVWMILFLAVLVGVAVLVVRWLSGPGAGGAGAAASKTPLDILRERFAHGEIDKDEFEERKRVLGE